ncbi:MAG TPA: hypothetical protein VG650_14170 [Mycobacteriales bacterium]|nr:hypothetical protein [Mycobacteriales bacterium]
MSTLTLLAVTAEPASAYGSKRPPVAGRWVLMHNQNGDVGGQFTITHGPVTVHDFELDPDGRTPDECGTDPITLVGSHRMHLYSGKNVYGLTYVAWAIGRNTPNGRSRVIQLVPVTFARDGKQFSGKLVLQIQFPRGGATPKTDGEAQFKQAGQTCGVSFNVAKA